MIAVASSGAAAARRVIGAEAAYRDVARTGALSGADIAGDLDLSRFHISPGATRILVKDVRVQGRLHASGNGPAVPVSIEDAMLHVVDLARARLRAALVLERSTVDELARFEPALRNLFNGLFIAPRKSSG